MITEQQPGTRVPELYEVLELIDQESEESKIVEIVQSFGSKYSWFTDYLRCVFDEKIQFNLPPGKPPYTPAGEAQVPSSWHRQHIQVGYWVRGLKGDNLNAIKRESMFIRLLEGIHPEDAVHIVLMTEKKTSTSGLTREIVDKALPNLIA
jgi:hypothetical protein